MKMLVTGGAGFIGSHLVDSLIDDGHIVHIIDDFSTGQEKNLNDKAILHTLGVQEKYSVGGVVRRVKPDYIFHLAARARIGDCHDWPVDSYEVNVQGTLYLLEAAREVNVSGFVFSSSSAVYGNVPPHRKHITVDEPKNPISMYGVQKLNAETLVLGYAKSYGLRAAALRYFNVYGTARQNPAGAYPNVFAAFGRDVKGGEITIFGDGEQRRDYVHVFDVVRANKAFIGKPDDIYGRSYNVGTGVTKTVNDIANYFESKRNYQPARVGDPKYSCAHIGSTQLALEWDPLISFEKGIQIFLNSLKETPYA